MAFRSRCRDHAPILLASGTVAFAIIGPFLIWGIPQGGDFFFHLTSWMDAARQWHQGVWFPRWAALANYGAGEPRFIFYPPISWNLGALLSLIFPWRAVPGMFVWLALTAAGVCSFHLAQEWLPRRESLIAAVLFVANPYFFLDLYRRSAYAELLAAAILPLVILFALRMVRGEKRSSIWLALVLAAEWLTSVPVAVISTYVVAGIVVYGAIARSVRIVIFASMAYALAFGLAAVYLLPAIAERKWINMGVLFWLPPEQTLFPPPDRVSALFVIVAVEAVIVMFAAIAVLRFSPDRKRWGILIGLAGVPLVLISRPSLFVWHHAPLLRFVQFPWRWLCVFNLAAAVLIVSAVRLAPARARTWLWGFVGILIVASGVRLHGKPVDARLLALVVRGVDRGVGYGGMREYTPAGVNADFATGPPLPAMLIDPTKPPRPGVPVFKHVQGGAVTVTSRTPDSMAVSANTAQPAFLLLNLMAYPAWRVLVDDQQSEMVAYQERILVRLPPGHNHIAARFTRTRDRIVGTWISAVAVLIVFAAARLLSKQNWDAAPPADVTRVSAPAT